MQECRNRSGNLIDRKRTKFYVETISQKFLNSEKNIFFAIEKQKVEIFSKVKKVEIFQWKIIWFFIENFHQFFFSGKMSKFFNFLFFDREKIYIFSELRFFLDIVSMQNFVLFRSMRFPDRFRHSFLANQPKRFKKFFFAISVLIHSVWLYQVAENRELSVLSEELSVFLF